MSIRKLKFWSDNEIYGDQMNHFLSRLRSLPLHPNEIRYNDVD